MTKRSTLFSRLLKWLAAVLIATGTAAGAQAQGLTVETIIVDGQPAQAVAGVQVRLPGTASGQPQTLKAGQAISPGAELTLPRGVIFFFARKTAYEIIL